MAPNSRRDPILPFSVATRIDAAHVAREVEAVDDFLEQSHLRQPGAAVVLPRTSRLLEEIVKANGLNLLQPADRASLTKFLAELQEHAPILHFSFATEPSGAFLQRLVEWLRSEIHPLALVDVGLQPNIAVGCVMRTTSKRFDFSLRQHLLKQRSTLVELLSQDSDPKPQPQPQVQAQPQPEAAA